MSMSNRLQKIIEAGLRFPKYRSFLDFLETGFELNREDRFEHFQLRFTPWLRFVADVLDNHPEIQNVFLLQASQTGKTTCPMAYLLYEAQREPCRMLWIHSTETEALGFVKERLRPYIENFDSDALKRREWKLEAFKVYNARVRISYSTVEQRSWPCKIIIGDEWSLWGKCSVSHVLKRLRTFQGRGRAIFTSTPPRSRENTNYLDAVKGNVFAWFVPCPHCHELFRLSLQNLKWDGKEGEGWNYEAVEQTAHMVCPHCQGEIWEEQKIDMINEGRAVCVSPDTWDKVEEKKSDTVALFVSSLYTPLTTWGKLAVMFLESKDNPEALRNFITDELCETTKDIAGESLKTHELAKYIDVERERGYVEGYQLYTAGVDVQRKGEMFWVVVGWRGGSTISGHVLDYGRVGWLDADKSVNFEPLLDAMKAFPPLSCVSIDASDGVVQQTLFDFCNYQGKPYTPLVDSSQQIEKVIYRHLEHNPQTKQRYKVGGLLQISINSAMIKDEIATALSRSPDDPGAWTFPSGTEEIFFKHLSNEERGEETRRGRKSSVWVKKYRDAPQHYFSALVYAVAAMEDMRKKLIQGIVERPKIKLSALRERKIASANEGGQKIRMSDLLRENKAKSAGNSWVAMHQKGEV